MKASKEVSPVLAMKTVSRRRFVTGIVAGSSAIGMGIAPQLMAAAKPAASHQKGPKTLRGREFDLSIDYLPVNFTGRQRIATTIDGPLPGPVLRWKEGERVTLRVTNNLEHDSSIHWHGIILPTEMDGVPGFSFDGIKPGETFEYQFDVNQSGTYWYHSHSGFQEQTGAYGAIVIEPKEADPVAYDRDYVVMLSDWSDTAPEKNYAKLKKMGDYFNFRERTVGDLWQDIKDKGIARTWNDRAMWNKARMSDRDIADVTGYAYTYLMNGVTPSEGWLGLFKAGEKVRLRFVNSAAMTIFDVRIPGLKMTVVATDGQNIKPVTIDEFRISVAETYDVIVEPEDGCAYTVFAQSIDRSGYTRGTLSQRADRVAEIPIMDPAPILGHGDMGMSMEGMDHSQHAMGDGSSMEGMDHSQHNMSKPAAMAGMDHSMHQMDMDAPMMGMDHSQHQMSGMRTMQDQSAEEKNLGKAGFGSATKITHVESEFGPHVDMRADSPQRGLDDPGIGLRQHQALYGRKVLTYADIKNYYPTLDTRQPSREIELHLTGNMHRYMWSMNGIKFKDAAPVLLSYGERVRIVIVNDTMMNHPIHLHGMWSELETGDPEYIPRKHTINVQPGSQVSYLVTADAVGRWAYHCHLAFHMPGMFREVRVTQGEAT